MNGKYKMQYEVKGFYGRWETVEVGDDYKDAVRALADWKKNIPWNRFTLKKTRKYVAE